MSRYFVRFVYFCQRKLMIENIKLFLSSPKKTEIYKILNVNDDELKILKKMLEEYINGNEDVKVKYVIKEIFAKEGVEALEYMALIKNLIEEGWLVLSTISQIKTSDLTILETFNSAVSLSVSFLKLIEKGSLDLVVPEKTPYNDHLEYLYDQFLRIEIYEQLSNFKANYSKDSANIKRLQSKLKLIENTIKEKLKKQK